MRAWPGAISLSAFLACGPAELDPPGDEENAPLACEIEAKAPCTDCFLFLAAFDRWSSPFDQWLAFDGAKKIEVEPPVDGDEAGVAVTAEGVGMVLHLPFFATEMQYSLFKDGAWSEAQPVGFTGAGNMLAADGRCVHLIYRDADAQRRHTIFDGASWHAVDETLPPDPHALRYGSLVARDGELVHLFTDASQKLRSVSWTQGWQPSQVIGESHADTVPQLAALRSGAEFMAVDGGRYATRVAGEWAPLADIPGVSGIRSSSVAALRDGRVVVAWLRREGYDVQFIEYSLYDPVARTWTPPVEVTGARVDAGPVVIAGAAGAEFFLGYVFDGAGDSTLLLRIDGEDVEFIADHIFGQDIALASTP